MTGWKEWGIGEVVEAGEFQSYIQDQTVQVHADSTARGTALGTAVAEGMVSYLQDSNSVQVYDGSAWQAIAPLSHNYIINGAFDISQRGTAITGIAANYTYTADRWFVERGGTIDYAQRQVGSYNPPANFDYYAEIVNQTASNPFQVISQTIETKNLYPIAGKEVTVSFWARAHANTTASKYLKLLLRSSTSVDTKNGTVLANPTYTLNFGTAATDWQRITHTVTIPANARSFTVTFSQDQTLAVGDGFHITGVQLEAGSVATPFKRNAPSLQEELAACQRYYIQTASSFPMPAGAIAYATNGVACSVQFPGPMRATPSVAITGFRDAVTGTTSTVTSLNAEFTNQGIAHFLGAFSAGVLTVGRGYSFGYTASAEL